jgi:hypothetical protein
LLYERVPDATFAKKFGFKVPSNSGIPNGLLESYFPNYTDIQKIISAILALSHDEKAVFEIAYIQETASTIEMSTIVFSPPKMIRGESTVAYLFTRHKWPIYLK